MHLLYIIYGESQIELRYVQALTPVYRVLCPIRNID